MMLFSATTNPFINTRNQISLENLFEFYNNSFAAFTFFKLILSVKFLKFLFYYVIIYRVSKKSGKISRKLSISERNLSYKSYRVSNDLFTDQLISLTLDNVIKVK